MTARSVAFCRGINVGGHRATKQDLIDPVAGLGHRDVDTFLASGNILFTPATDDGQPDADAMASALEAALGFPVPVTIRTGDELEFLAAAAPFDAEQLEAAAVGKPQVIFLFDRTTAGLAAAAEAARTRSNPDDLLVADEAGGAVHWLPAEGISGSGIAPAELTALFSVHTVRTANTVTRLLKKA